MKKLSLLLVFVMLFVVLFAFSAFASSVTSDDVKSSSMNGGGGVWHSVIGGVMFNGSIEEGNIYGWTDQAWYGSGNGSSFTLVFKEEINVSAVAIYAIATDGTFKVEGKLNDALVFTKTASCSGANETVYKKLEFITSSDNLSYKINKITVTSVSSGNGQRFKISELEILKTVHVHSWKEATCQAPKTCLECGATEGNVGDHTWTAASCTAPRTCSTCNATDGVALGHEYSWEVKGCKKCGTSVEKFDNVVYAKTLDDIKNAPNGYVVIVVADVIEVTNNSTYLKNSIYLDLNGKILRQTHGSGGLWIDNDGIVIANGFVDHKGGVAAFRVKGARIFEQLVIECSYTNGNGIITGINIRSNENVKLDYIKNVTMSGIGLGQGVEILSTCSVGYIDNVIVKAVHEGKLASDKHIAGLVIRDGGTCGPITNCTFDGKISGARIESATVDFKNCKIIGGREALYVYNASTITYDAQTSFTSESGALFNSNTVIDAFTNSAVATIALTNKVTSNIERTTTIYFDSLEKAIAAANAGETIKLVKNIDLATAIEVDKVATIDLNGMELTVKTDTKGNGVFMVVKNGVLTINGEGTVNGVGNNNYNIAIWANGGSVVINGGTYTNVGATDENGDDHFDLIYAKNGGSVVINGGTFIAQTPKWTLNVCDKTGGSFIVKGGTFPAGFNPGATETELADANNDFIPAGYYLNGNTVEECKAHNLTTLTCTDDSVCTICQYVDKVATGHTMADATCTAPKTCTACGATEGAALGHSWQNATCTAPKTCTVCMTTEGTALGHQSDVPATCKDPATCKVCGEEFGNPDPNAHESVVTIEAVPATCTTAGSTAGSRCEACNTVIDAPQTIEKLAHTYNAVVTYPTCTEKGYTTYTCVCGDTYTDNETAANGHGEYSWNLGTNEKGEQMYGCSVCGANDYVVLVNSASGISNAAAGSVVRLTTDLNIGSLISVAKEGLLIDLGGHTITSTSACQWSALVLYECAGLVNGRIVHMGGTNAIKSYNVGKYEDLTIEVNQNTYNWVGGITMYSKEGYPAKLDSMYNVTIKGTGLTNKGLEVPGYAIGSLEKVYIYSKGQAFTTSAPSIGTIKDCVFSGDDIGINVENLQCTYNLENCEIYGGELAVRIKTTTATEKAPTAFTFDSATTIRTAGTAFDVSAVKNNKHCNTDVFKAAVAVVNGQLYSDLDVAMEALMASEKEVTDFALINDLYIDKAIVINKKVNFSLGGGTYEIPNYGASSTETIKLSGYTIYAKNATDGNGIFHVVKGGVLTLSGEGTVNAVSADPYDFHMAVWADGGEVIINGGTFTNVGAGEDDQYDLIYAKNGGSVVINGGTFIAQTPKWTLNIHGTNTGTIVVNGGSFYMYNPTESASESPVVDFTSGKCAVKNSENYYVVVGEHQYFNACDARCEACDKITKEPTHNIVHVTAKAPTCTANGNVEYWYCDICGAAWTDEALTQLTNQKSVIVPATGHSYANDCDKACAVCYEITRPEADHTIVHVDAKAATCTANGNKEYWTCSDCGYAWLDEACTLVANQKSVIVPATGHSYFTQCDPVCMNCYELTNPDAAHKITHVTAVAPTCTENGNIEYWYCEYCNTAWTSEALNTPPMGIKSTTLPATGHTKVEIPAVRPTPSNGNKAYTAGIKCADCNDIIQEVEEITVVQNQNTGFQIYNASLGLSDDITLIYLTYIPEEYRENAYMVFTYRGTEYVVDTKEEKDGIYRFRFSAVTPQYVGENIESVLYSKVNGEYVKTGTINYSVLAFCASWLNYDKTPVKTRTLMSDFLVYAAAAQVATNVNVDKLVTDGFGDKLTPSTFSKLDDSQFVMRLEGTADSRFAWKNVSLTLGSSVAMKFYFTATETENLKIKITINGRTQIIDFADCEYDTTYECYTASFTNITAIEFADEVKAEFMVGEEIVGNSALYTIDSFVYQWQSVTDSKYEKTINLVKALYNYGKSAWNSVH